MFHHDLVAKADALLRSCRVQGLRLTTAESCTGGLVAGLLTHIAGASDVFERGFVTYSDAAKSGMLDVPADVITRHGAVSAAVAVAMAEGALKRSSAHLSVSVTGVAGPGGGTAQKPVGLVYIAVAHAGMPATAQRFQFPAGERQAIRMASVAEAVRLLTEVAER